MKKWVIVLISLTLLVGFVSAQDCTDSDGGTDYSVKGVATGIYAGGISSMHFIYGDGDVQQLDGAGETIYYDHCANSVQLNEAFCGSDGRLHAIAQMCSNGCENGVCIPEVEPECPGIPISEWCPDETTLCSMTTDEQGCSVWDCDACETTPEPPEPEPETCAAKIEINFDKYSYVVGEQFEVEIGIFDSQGNPIPNYLFYAKMYDDRWHTPDQDRTDADGYFRRSSGEIEQLPSGVTNVMFEVYTEEVGTCSSVQDTIEIEVAPGPEPPEPRPEPEPEPRPETCAARISISFDKNVYYVGEEFKVELGIFDSQGNPIPNYLFYIKVYDYEKGMWHTSFEDDRTDGDGYQIHQGKMEIGEPFRFGKNKLKIYTDVGGCALVEDIAIIEVKRREGPDPVPCGMGSCVHEPEPSNISDGGGFYSCSGCEADEKCYPIGYRKSGAYCTPDNVFVSQMEKGECDNSFECASNVCISGECLTENFIEKIIAWFRKMFGGGDEDGVEKKCSKLLLEHNIGEYRYEKSIHGEDEHTQAPLFSEDGEHIGTIKCCAALYTDKEDIEHGVLFCAYDSKEDVTNSVKWLIAKERNIVFKEYEDEKVFGDDKGQIVAWINNAYLIAVGVGPAEKNIPLPEDIANAYLKKYPSEFELTEDDIPDAPPERPWVYCTEEDEEKGNKCESQAGAQLQTNPHPENKSCEVYVGCILPHEKCENIDDIDERNNCYVGVAEMTGDSSVCEKITSDERRNKCYVKAVETSKDVSICEKITEDNIKEMCFELAEVVSGERYGPAIVQGQEWYSKFNRGGLSDEFSFSGEQIKGDIKLDIIQGRGYVSITQYPAEENDFETIILFDDDEFGNPDYYEINVLDNTGRVIFTFEDCIDGSDYLIIKDNTVQYRHRNYQNPGEHEACRHL